MNVFTGNIDDTPWHVFQFFQQARKLLGSKIWYEAGYADEYLSFADRQEVLKRFDTAIEKSQVAWWYTYNNQNDHKTAIGIWRQIFGEQFPTYG